MLDIHAGCSSPVPARGMPALPPAGNSGTRARGDRFAWASIDYWTVMRFFGSRGRARPRCLERPGFFADPPLLPFRSAFLFASARVRFSSGDSLRSCFLGHGARMAVPRPFPVRPAEPRVDSRYQAVSFTFLPGAGRADSFSGRRYTHSRFGGLGLPRQ